MEPDTWRHCFGRCGFVRSPRLRIPSYGVMKSATISRIRRDRGPLPACPRPLRNLSQAQNCCQMRPPPTDCAWRLPHHCEFPGRSRSKTAAGPCRPAFLLCGLLTLQTPAVPIGM
eukprot:gene9559-biopygen2179